MRRLGRLCETLIVAVVATRSVPSRAADSPRPRAEQLFYDGRQALARHDYVQAADDFEQSLALAPRGSALRNLANAEWALGRPVDALHHLRAAVARSDLPSENRARAEQDAAALYAATGHLAVRTERGARLWIDGAPVEGVGPWAEPLDVMAGLRTVEARLGNERQRVHVEAPPGVLVPVDVLAPPAAPPAPAVAPPHNPEALAVPARAPSAEPALSRTSAGFSNGRRAIGVAAAGAGLAALAVGLAFFAKATADERTASSASAGLGAAACAGANEPAGCGALNDALASQRADAAASRVLVGAGVLALAAGGVLLVWPAARADAWAMVPSVGPSGAHLGLQGRF